MSNGIETPIDFLEGIDIHFSDTWKIDIDIFKPNVNRTYEIVLLKMCFDYIQDQ